MTTYLVDNSIWQKASTSEAIATRLRELSPTHLIITCPPQVLEYCHSARSPQEYQELRADMEQFLPAWEHPDEQQALDVQQALWDTGLMRAAAAFDCLIAAYAVVNDAVILNSDHDFGFIEIATRGAIRQEYVAA
ncbi:VapC toxin family PIN domain ribonuclease [Microbacterium trichothecenolyticum]|uniref:VapC toxin family PIN domain ribonuclease n=1 Tax=Microbacterium ureisolvens TaxID=2781186 RepID=A0ABS7HXD2_9MICO|nr:MULTISPECIES: PIN domain-containing protein [Microbacterium]MBW9110034.1 VapC toxin family PIN domain ribonuclease [Microbacterium ureisolvens]MBW9119331.1 VapC toxin family PIN domain ribonuclease [Microbacterium trichothecenolyticum]